MISFESNLGWIGLLLGESQIFRIKFGFKSQIQLLKSFDEYFDLHKPDRMQLKWVDLVKGYASGQPVDLSDVPVNMASLTKFQSKVLRSCRKIPYGATISYGQLASKARYPGAARAVGSAMKINRCPLVVPCHRVVGRNGIGGYSASAGIAVKKRLLELEGVSLQS